MSPFRRLAPCNLTVAGFDILICVALPLVVYKGGIDAERYTLALGGKTSCFYDVTTSKEYEVKSAALTSDECLQIEQMLTSRR